MFFHQFKYSLKVLFKSKMLIFWTFAFPLILGTFFYMAFSNIEQEEQFDVIDIAIIKNEKLNENKIFKETFKELGREDNENRLFSCSYVTKKQAKKLLAEDKITGYIELKDTPVITVKSSGIEETILKYVVDEVSQTEDILLTLIQSNKLNSFSANLYQDALELLNQNEKMIEDKTSKNLSYTMIEFYTLIAMTCLYGGILGMVAVNQNLANMSDKGKRVSISPVSKGNIILSSVLASYLVQLIGVALLLIYTFFILKVDYGSNMPLVILLSLVGSLAGLSLGVFLASAVKASENTKTGLILAITMLGCFLSGMMGITMKYLVDQNLPLVNLLNPANMITDGFYALYYYDTLNRYFFNIISLLIFSLVLILLSSIVLRRQKYDNI